ncbi:hypothetical protein F511_39847 [Dorcoceras hygrometricum]|uniref:Protein kinase domain-containing protein n=1 Tax=Dorcoceras hygrometricum TaxID=472368 RepID=A0A2Z7A3B9_9LAMI|nr:hypothetical protein F511_32084 [Dorcoceras hygrometricum]KZV54820.1 hypothetical protein F511_39847 [Dorcoceras hygrometricum]
MAMIDPSLDNGVNECVRRKKYASRSKEGHVGTVIKKTTCDLATIPSSRDSRRKPKKRSKLFKKTRFSVRGNTANLRYGRLDEYEVLDEICRGSYGKVYKGKEKETGRMVAIKKELDGFCKSSYREIDILKSVVGHPSFVQFKQVVVDEYKDDVYVVMEYIENDLRRSMKSMETPFNESQVKALMKQLMEGVNFLHENGMMHRDLKPSNILVNNKGELKICDFGMSRQFRRALGSYSPRVGTLWYKAPELLLGAEKYSCAVDMWAVGCIMAELFLEDAIFKGDSEIDQLQKIFGILGTPDDIVWPGFSSLPGSRFKFVEQPFNMLSMNFTIISGLGIDLLNKLLACNPEERITAKDAINHPWFHEKSSTS